MTLTPAQFARQQIAAQGLTVKQFSHRSGLGISHAYQILRGERDKMTPETIDAIARGLSMTPAEMFIGMGKGISDVSVDELEFLTILRRVPFERRPAARDMLHGLAVPPLNRGLDNGPRDGSNNRRKNGRRQLDSHNPQGDNHGTDPSITGWYSPPVALLATIGNLCRSLLRAPNSQSLLQPAR